MAKEDQNTSARTDKNVRTTEIPAAQPVKAPVAGVAGRGPAAPAMNQPAAADAASKPPTNSGITSESNFNQAKTTGEHRDSERKATDEAEAQKKAHPGGLPLPTSGQPVTKPEPDQQ